MRQAPVNSGDAGADRDAGVSSYSDTDDHSNTNCRSTNCNASRDIRALADTLVNSCSDASGHTDRRVYTSCDVARDTDADAAVTGFSNTGGHSSPHANGHAQAGSDANHNTYTHSGTNGNTGKRSGRAGTQPRFI